MVLYSIIAAYYFLNKPAGGGDESLFLADLELINNEGWIEAIKQNISIPYMLLVYPLSFFLNSFIALRLVNVILLLLLLFYFYKMGEKKDLLFYGYMMFYVSTIGFFYAGINDILFIVALVIFLDGIYRVTNNKSTNINLTLTALVVAFFTRQLFLVYLPIIILGLYILFKSKIKFNKKSLIPFLVFIVFLVFNLPSIKENGTLSFDKKSPPETMNVTWAQRQYLAQIMVNKGELENGQHPSWEQTQQYLKLHGKESLPNGVLKGITQDYQLTIKEFFKDFVFSIFYGTRQLGLMLLIIILFSLNQVYKTRRIELKYFVPIATLAILMIFSFIIISYVELRWLIPVFIMTIVFYDDLEKENRISIKLVSLNYLVLISFSIYGIIRILNKIYL
ncbi:MAG: hypothetical protein CVU08_14220 [Bacteroidetes bacterium HGW-Bacteroidetes-3]|jgi:hypothetical protein|nr:MAG: hypothetical protein CVU08_14220 [Bacteroidetes bacterium HGW-Bacteroidetes-3]